MWFLAVLRRSRFHGKNWLRFWKVHALQHYQIKPFGVELKNVTIWTDTTTVLSWIKNDAIRLNRYVCRKLEKLEPLYHQFEHVGFQHVQTNLNPADIASRGLNLVRNTADRLQFHGNQSTVHRNQHLSMLLKHRLTFVVLVCTENVNFHH